jgi:transcriptional regulator with XRE-family HTH domain
MEAHITLKAERERQNITGVQMAQYLGVSEDMIRRYDSGRSAITLKQAARYAERLGYQLGDLLPSSQIRSGDLQPFIMALQDFEPDEREDVIHKATQDLVFLAARLNDRAIRRRAPLSLERRDEEHDLSHPPSQ